MAVDPLDAARRRLQNLIAAITDKKLGGDDDDDEEEEVANRVSALFNIEDANHAEFVFIYPARVVPGARAGVKFSSLSDAIIYIDEGVRLRSPWAALIHRSNEAWWAERVRALNFPAIDATTVDGAYTLGLSATRRIMGDRLADALENTPGMRALNESGASNAARSRMRRALALLYLRAYRDDASPSFLSLFVHYLSRKKVKRWVTDELGQYKQVIVAEDSLLSLKDDLAALDMDAASIAYLKEPVEAMEPDAAGPNEQQQQPEEDEPAIQPGRRTLHRQTSVLDALTTEYTFITTLELRLAGATLRYKIYQRPAQQASLYIRMDVVGSTGRPLEVAIQIEQRALRVLKFYHKEGADDLLILYVAMPKGGLLLRVPCRALEPVVRVSEDRIDARLYNDVFFIDTVDNPYAADFCTWARASARLESPDGLRIMRAIALYQATLDNVAPPEPKTVLQQLIAERKELEARDQAQQQEKAVLEKEVRAIADDIRAKEEAAVTLVQRNLLKARLKPAQEALNEKTAELDQLEEKLNKNRARNSQITVDIRNERKKPSPAPQQSAEAVNELPPLALGIEKLAPMAFRGENGVEVQQPLYVYLDDIAAGRVRVIGARQRIVHACKVITIPSNPSGVADRDLRESIRDYRKQNAYVTVAVLCERPNSRAGVHQFELHLYRLELNRQASAYVVSGTPLNQALGDKANVPLNINLNDPARAFKVLDFDVVFYDDAMGHSYTVQVEVEDAGGVYTTCARSRRDHMTFLPHVVPQTDTTVTQTELVLFDQLSFAHSYRTVQLPSSIDGARYNYLFYKQRPDDTVRFIFMRLLREKTTQVFQIDVEGLRVEWIESFAPSLYSQAEGLLYLVVAMPGNDGLFARAERRVLLLGAGEEIHEFDAKNKLWFLERQLSGINLDASVSAAHRPCAWCSEPTTLQDELSRKYYCNELCQALLCTAKGLM